MSQTIGAEWFVDAIGCEAALLRDDRTLLALCERIIAEQDLHVIGAGHWHQFPGSGGWTGLYLLTESHLACHTYPEAGIVTFNLYCCRERDPWPWEQRLRESLGATAVRARTLRRGATADATAT